MATVNLGRIKPVFRGAYAGGTAYVVDDIVTSGNETFICIQASTGNATSNASYWTKLAAKGTDGTDVGATLTTQGDILYRDGSGLQRLGAGTSGQLLKTQGTGANPVWATVAGGAFGQVVYAENSTNYQNTNQTNYVRATNTKIDITPSATGKEILVVFNKALRFSHTDSGFEHRIIRIVGGTETVIRQTTSVYEYFHISGNGSWNKYDRSTSFIKDAPNTTSQVTYTLEFKNPHRTDVVELNPSGNHQTSMIALEIN